MKSTGRLKYLDPETDTWVDLGVVTFEFGTGVSPSDFSDLAAQMATKYVSQFRDTVTSSICELVTREISQLMGRLIGEGRAHSYPGAGDPHNRNLPDVRSKHSKARRQRALARR